jgi:hypothetical protein
MCNGNVATLGAVLRPSTRSIKVTLFLGMEIPQKNGISIFYFHATSIFLERRAQWPQSDCARVAALPMPKDDCRESRAVPFSPSGVTWAHVANGKIWDSHDVDKMGKPKDPEGRPLLPFQNQFPPGMLSSQRLDDSRSPRQPLTPITNSDVAVSVLSKEIHALEIEREGVRTRIRMQDALILGVCNQEAGRTRLPLEPQRP